MGEFGWRQSMVIGAAIIALTVLAACGGGETRSDDEPASREPTATTPRRTITPVDPVTFEDPSEPAPEPPDPRNALDEDAIATIEAAKAAYMEVAAELAEASDVPWLTNEQLRDMSPVPPLPAIFNNRSSSQDLINHARMVARAEIESTMVGPSVTEDLRLLYLLHVWRPEFKARQNRMDAVQLWRDQRQAFLVQEARHRAVYERELDRIRREYREQVEAIRREINPILDEEDQRILRRSDG